MSCQNFVLDEDGEHICECGDEGRLCHDCYLTAFAYWLERYRVAPLSQRDPKAYEQDMRDAGRGHLLGDRE